MASSAASRLKKEWTEMPVECFEPLTFGELEVGQKFIFLPQPGDNSGHGGLRCAHRIFIKTHQGGLPFGSRYGRSIDLHIGTLSDQPDSMPVILVE